MSFSLFGTDGIRSRFGTPPLDPVSIRKISAVMAGSFRGKRILIGRDTRESGKEIETVMARIIGRSADVQGCGIIPTPGLTYSLKKGKFDYGLMISASHNPYHDNGIKILNRRGEKIPDRLEQAMERSFFSESEITDAGASDRKTAPDRFDGGEIYLGFLRNEITSSQPLIQTLVVDCANGAASEFAQRLFPAVASSLHLIHCTPDGKNINNGCGSTSPDDLRRTVIDKKAGLGIAFDGDADRVVFVASDGTLLEGDHILYLLSLYLKETHPRFNPAIVGTVMSNLQLELALRNLGFDFLRTPVGDRSVYREMKRRNATLGGEPSGHIILRHKQTGGDGLLVSLFFLRALRHFNLNSIDLSHQLPLIPQKVVSYPVKRRKNLDHWEELQKKLREFNAKEGHDSRILIRYSGTEPKIRIMIESKRPALIDRTLKEFSALIGNDLERT